MLRCACLPDLPQAGAGCAQHDMRGSALIARRYGVPSMIFRL